MHKCILKPTLFCPIQKETGCYLVLKMSVDVGLDKDLGDLPPLQSCRNMQGCVPVLKMQHSHIFIMHCTHVQFNRIHEEIWFTINLWHRWTNMAFVHFSLTDCRVNANFFLTDHTVIAHRKLLLLLNKLGLGTLYPDCTVVAHITAGEQTWHMYTLSWLYSYCSYYCWWTNLAYVHFILTVQLLLILLLLNLAYVHFFLTVQLLLQLTLLNKPGIYMYTFSSLTVQLLLIVMLVNKLTGICTFLLLSLTVQLTFGLTLVNELTALLSWPCWVRWACTLRWSGCGWRRRGRTGLLCAGPCPRTRKEKKKGCNRCHSSGAVWESRWPSWAVRPNEPSGFRGRKDLLNRASALVSACT